MLQHNQSMTATRPSDLKFNNRMQILELFKSGTVYSVADIARRVGISRQTVMKAIQFFLEKGIIVSEGKADSGSMGGKRAELFSLSADRYLINILFCPNCLYISLFNLRCEVIDCCRQRDIVALSVEELIDRAGRVCDDLMRRHGIRQGDLRGVCISTPGIVVRDTNRVRYNSLFPAWGKDIPLAQMLSDRLNTDAPIITENVGKVCGSAFLNDHRAETGRMAVVFSRWGGIAACLIDEGRIVNGRDSLVGEIGHMIIEPCDEEVCACGSRGCFERQVSVERLRLLASEWIGECPGTAFSADGLDRMTIREIFEASAKGDPLGRRLSEYTARYFASAMRNLCVMFNPGCVVFQGDYAHVDDHFRQEFYKELRAFRYFDDAPGDDHPFALRTDARSIRDLTTIGAYTLLLDRLFSDETTYS